MTRLRLLPAALFGLFALTAQAQVPNQATQQASLAQEPQAARPVVISCRTTIPSGKEPLYVVDGVPLELSNINSLNPQDILKIDILRHPQATALYGSRAINGVVLITSKPARKQSAVLLKQREQQHVQPLR